MLKKVSGYLREAQIPVRLACHTESGWPMVLSLWYLYEDGKLYCATQQSARVVAYLEHDTRCAFEVASERPPYCGVRGQGRATFDHERGGEILERLLKRYLGGTDGDLARMLLAKQENEVAIVIEPMKVFTWDFSQRMQDIQATEVVGLCPLLGDA